LPRISRRKDARAVRQLDRQSSHDALPGGDLQHMIPGNAELQLGKQTRPSWSSAFPGKSHFSSQDRSAAMIPKRKNQARSNNFDRIFNTFLFMTYDLLE